MSFRFIDNGGQLGLRSLGARERRLLRRHVMIGKNRNKTRRRQDAVLGGNGQQNHSPVTVCESKPHGREATCDPGPHSSRNLGNQLQYFQVAFDLKPYMRHAIYSYITAVMEALYPFQICLRQSSLHGVWFKYMCIEPAFLHCVLALSIGHTGFAPDGQSTQRNPVALFHSGRSLRLLNQKLQSPSDGLSESIFAVVIAFAMSEVSTGNLPQAKTHLDGLERMLEIKGGFRFLDGNRFLQQKILRADLDYSLRTGIVPRFTSDTFNTSTIMFSQVDPDGLAVFMENIPVWNSWLVKLDSRLRHFWMMLYQFTSSLNNRTPGTRNMQPLPFQDTLLWIEYRLLALPEFEPSQGLQSLLRSGMLAFMTTWINSSGIAKYEFLANRLRHLLLSVPENPPALLLWTLFVGAISVFTVDDRCWLLPKLSRTLRKLALKDWDEVRNLLESLPWVHFIHEKRAEEVWKLASAYRSNNQFEGPGWANANPTNASLWSSSDST